MKVLNFGFNDRINHIFEIELKRLYSQINKNTVIRQHYPNLILNQNLPKTIPAFEYCRKGFKYYLKRLIGTLINNEKMIMSTINKKPPPPVEKVFEIEKFSVRDELSARDYTIFFAYIPEGDAIYIQIPSKFSWE